MKLLCLTLEAFGPFKEAETVDFRALRFSRLFLIHGPVGSGKTFILDGICFALFGRSSGGERNRQGMRHLGTPAEQDSVVTLDFESGRQSYRVERRITQKDSELLDEDVTLWRLPEAGNPTRRDVLSATASGVTSMISVLLGLTAEQFCQVAILPQGRFREFLLSEGSDRRQILANMFNTHRHARLQSQLQRAYETARERLETAWSEREALISNYQDTDGDPRVCLSRSNEELHSLEDECKHHQHRSVEWERSLEEAVRFETLDRQRYMAERELEVLKDEEAETEEDLGERLQRALPEYEKWKRINADAEEISAALIEQRAGYERLKDDTNFLEEEVETARQVEEERFTLRRAVERLKTLSQEQEGLQLLEEELHGAEDRLEELGERRKELALEAKHQKSRIQEIKRELQLIAQAEDKLASLKEQLDDIAEHQNRLAQNRVLEEAYQQALEREERFLRMVDDLELEKKEIENRRHQEQARLLVHSLSALTERLEEGEPCPLCGSLEHPEPFDGALPSQEADAGEADELLEGVERRLQRARDELIQARERKAKVQGRLEERRIDDKGMELDESTLRSLRNTVTAVESKVSTRDSLEKELSTLKSEFKPTRVRLKKMRLLKERLETTVDGIAEQIAARRTTLLGSAREFFSQLSEKELDSLPRLVEKEIERLEERLQELEDYQYDTDRAELMAETFALQLAETRASERQVDQLVEEGEQLKKELMNEFRMEFADWEDLNFALSRAARESSVQSDQGQVLDRATLIKTVERQLSQSVELLLEMPKPEMKADQIRQALTRERTQLESKIGRRATLEKSVEQSSEDVRRYDRLVERIRDLEAKLQVVDKLASLARGENGLDFHDWYLDRIFRKVVEAANLRLELLAPNRFCLSLESGLEVRVLDFLAGKERPATTLSGGESFLASLALALGLGDVLQGDIDARDRLQTLFIDEGFGYLDRRALESALDCLEGLKQEGRTIGIVSHVPALRERIRAQVVVAANDSPLPYGQERVEIYAE